MYVYEYMYSYTFKIVTVVQQGAIILLLDVVYSNKYSIQNLSITKKDLIYCHYAVWLTRLFNGHTVNSSVTCCSSGNKIHLVLVSLYFSSLKKRSGYV